MPERNSWDQDDAARKLLSFILPMTKSTKAEYSGYICRDGDRYFWHAIELGSEGESSPVILNPDKCPSTAFTVGFAHTHPSSAYAALFPGDAERPLYPGGFLSEEQYLDNNPHTTQVAEWSDLRIADAYFAGQGQDFPQPKTRNLTWYLGTSPNYGPDLYWRYKRTDAGLAKDNVYLYNVRTWDRETPRW